MRQYGLLASAFVVGLAGCRTTKSDQSELATIGGAATKGCRDAAGVCRVGQECKDEKAKAREKQKNAETMLSLAAESKELAAAAGGTAFGVDVADKEGTVANMESLIEQRTGKKFESTSEGEVLFGGEKGEAVQKQVLEGKLGTKAQMAKVYGSNEATIQAVTVENLSDRDAGRFAPERISALLDTAGVDNPKAVEGAGIAMAASVDNLGRTNRDWAKTRPTAFAAVKRVLNYVTTTKKMSASNKLEVAARVRTSTDNAELENAADKIAAGVSLNNIPNGHAAMVADILGRLMFNGNAPDSDYEEIAKLTGIDAKTVKELGGKVQAELAKTALEARGAQNFGELVSLNGETPADFKETAQMFRTLNAADGYSKESTRRTTGDKEFAEIARDAFAKEKEKAKR